MVLSHGIIIVNGISGFYYTPPDDITRCLIRDTMTHKIIKFELQGLLREHKSLQYRELIGDSTLFKLALLRYEMDELEVDLADYSFEAEYTYRAKISSTSSHQWLSFFDRKSLHELMTV